MNSSLRKFLSGYLPVKSTTLNSDDCIVLLALIQIVKRAGLVPLPEVTTKDYTDDGGYKFVQYYRDSDGNTLMMYVIRCRPIKGHEGWAQYNHTLWFPKQILRERGGEFKELFTTLYGQWTIDGPDYDPFAYDWTPKFFDRLLKRVK